MTTNPRDVAAEALRLMHALSTADQIQWEPSPVPKPRTDTTQRAQGGHGDPTADIVFDPRRLAVREAVTHAEQTLEMFATALRNARENVEQAVARWNGEG